MPRNAITRTYVVAAFFIFISGCASQKVKKYQEIGSPNFTIHFDSDNGFFSKSKLAIYFFNNFKDCHYRNLGEVLIQNHQPQSIAVPVDATISFKTSISTNHTFGSNDRSHRGEIYFKPKKSESYLLEMARENNSIGTTLYREMKGKKEEIYSLENHCRQYVEDL